jgi:hypothetical protein
VCIPPSSSSPPISIQRLRAVRSSPPQPSKSEHRDQDELNSIATPLKTAVLLEHYLPFNFNA